MKQNLFNKLWLRVGMIVAIMTTALAGTAWAEAETVTYTVTSTSAVSTSGTAPTGSSASYNSTYTTACQLTKGNSMSLTLSGYEGYKITGITLSMKSNSKGGSGSLSVTAGNTNIASISTAAFNSNSWYGAWSTSYVDVTVNMDNDSYEIQDGENVVITIAATANSLYCQSFTLTYEEVSGSGTPSPSISAENVEIAYNATSGSIAYTLTNGVSDGVVTAATTSDWLTLGNGTTSPISFTCSANTTKVSRTATVTLTYTYNTDKTVTKNVTVTQAGNPNIIDNIEDITAAGTYAVQGTIVAKSQRGFIVGDGTGYVYYYNQNYAQSNYNIGDKVKLAGSVVAYGGVYEFDNSTTVTTVTESSYVSEEPTVLTGAQMDTRVGSSEAALSSYIQYQGVLSVSGNYYNITNISGASTAKGSISYPINTEFASLAGKAVKVTGYYVGVSSSQYYNTMIGSIEEIAIPVINVSASNVELAYDATSGEITYTIANPTDATLTATSSASWISNITVGASSVTFTTTANNGTTDREATIILSYTGAESVTVTVTQGHFVADYAELPFEFDGGQADIAGTAGLTESGLGSDYKNSPYLKLDGTGDYVLLKINERPGVLTFDIKGNGAGSDPWAGTFKVQTSTDGTTYTDLKTYDALTSTTQSESFSNLGADVRYIKWIYAEKTSGNVALGNIALAEYTAPVPTIIVAPATVDAPASVAAPDANEGTLNITCENLTVTGMNDFAVQFYDAEGEETTKPAWIDVVVAEQDPSVGTGYVVSYVLVDNDGDARTAYFKVYVGSVYSNVVTVNQAAYVAPFTPVTYTLATAITSGKHYIIVGMNDENAYAMGEQKSNNRAGVGVTVSGTTATVSTADVHELVIYGPDANGRYSIYDAGYLYAASSSGNQLKTRNSNSDGNSQWTINFDNEGVATITAQGENSRKEMHFNPNNGSPLFACYAVGNPTGSLPYLYEKDGEATPTESVTVTPAGYATYYSENTLDFTGTGITAYVGTLDGTSLTFTPITKAPAYTGLLLVANGGTSKNVPVATTVEAVTNNCLEGTLTGTTLSEDDYILNVNSSGKAGFYKAGTHTSLGAHKAYIPAVVGGTVKSFAIDLDDDATGIGTVESFTEEGAIFNLAGQRISKMQKGINIVNGKKILK